MRGKTFLVVFILLASLSLLFGNDALLNQGNNKISLVKNFDTEISIDYRLNSLAAQTISTTNGEFTQLSLTEFGLTGKEGEPQLPYSSKIIAVPEGAKVITTLTTYSSREIRLNEQGFNSLVLPAQPSVSKSAKPEDIKFIINENIYQSVDYIQQTQVEAIEIGYLRGMRLFEVNYYPVTYNPTKNSLSIIQEATLDIQFAGADMSATQYLRDKTFSPAFEVSYPTTIFNYQSNRSTLESYPLGYIIVTPNNFLATMQPFINWKTEQGYNVTVLNTAIIGSSRNNIFTAIENIWNSATPTNPAPSYLLLVGDTPQIPAWVGTTDSYHVTDLPYVELAGNDYLPEMYYGRFSANNISELQPQVTKTLIYEKYEMADPSYLAGAILIAGVDADNANTFGNGFLNYASQNYFNPAHGIDSSNYYYPESGSNDDNIIAGVSAGTSYVHYTAHGSPTSWGNPSFEISDINSLTNNQKYPIVIGNACLTNKFDEPTCFGEAWLRATNGSVIYIGGSNNTYWLEDYSWAVGAFAGSSPGMLDALFHDSGQEYANWANSAGSMLYQGNMTIQASPSGRKAYYWEIYSVMGDPSLIPFVGVPTAQFPNYAHALLLDSTSLDITAAPHSYVALTVSGEIIGTQILDSTGSGTVTFPALSTSQPVKMVISRVDYQPYITEIPVVTSTGPYLSLTNYSVNDSNNNGLLEYGETGSLNLTIENIGTATSGSGTITFTESDPYLTLTSTSASFTAINAGGSSSINSVINFEVANNIPNNHAMTLEFVISANGEQYTGNVSLVGKSYVVQMTDISFNDISLGNGDNIINLGETFEIVATIHNYGTTASPASSAIIQNANFISFADSTITITAIPVGSNQVIRFLATASNSIPIGELVTFTVKSTYPNAIITNSIEVVANLLQIGTGDVRNTHLPLEPYYSYSYTQTIYQASELNLEATQINKIAYHFNGHQAWTDAVVIYMGNTAKSNFTSTTNWVSLSNLTEVYNGNLSTTATAGWIEIELTTPFLFDGTSNLVIGFDENTPGYREGNNDFYCYVTPTNRSIYYYNDSTNPAPASPPAGTLTAYNPNIRIYASEVATAPMITVNTNSLDFGQVIMGNTATKTFNIKNSGVGTLSGSITLPDNFSFATRNSAKENSPTRIANQDFSLGAGASEDYIISYTATSTGSFSGNMTITSNDPNNMSVEIPLLGEAISPAHIAVNAGEISVVLQPEQTEIRTVSISNSGDFALNCSLNLQFPERRDVNEIFSANFDDHDLTNWVINSPSSSDHTWHITNIHDGSSFNNTPFLLIDSYSAGYATLDDTIETPTFNVSNCSEITIEFDHYYRWYREAVADVEFWTGSEWINLGRWQSTDTGSWTAPAHFSHTLINEGYSDVKLRFHYYNASWEWYWAIDNLVVSSEEVPVPQWVKLPNEFNNITVASQSSETFTLNFSAVDFALGDYSAMLNINSNATNNSSVSIPISLTIGNEVLELIAPYNVEVEIINSQANISWEAVPYADYYEVYYSADLSSWTEIAQVSGTTYQHSQPRGEAAFYKIRAIKN